MVSPNVLKKTKKGERQGLSKSSSPSQNKKEKKTKEPILVFPSRLLTQLPLRHLFSSRGPPSGTSSPHTVLTLSPRQRGTSSFRSRTGTGTDISIDHAKHSIFYLELGSAGLCGYSRWEKISGQPVPLERIL
ncbi:hypothetical protein QJS10_CPA02g01241 [Acorus calamus]|uniref:Uncharacterized protein n=1 Tax=Acorus calamus TaxID=4465 RepID=A0AAV9FEM2_ACOCL|nr:hypothetical protein QJS10_CPA02g01241 [Acorus calamus]